jgi:O-methyltransferase domain
VLTLGRGVWQSSRMGAEEQVGAALEDLVASVPRALVVRALVELGVPDRLSAGDCTLAELASSTGVAEQPLRRLMLGASGLGISDRLADGRYRLSAAGELLGSDHPDGLASWILLMTAPWTLVPWTRLAECVRRGTPAFPEVHGVGFWEFVSTHPKEAGVLFDSAMTSGAAERAQDLLTHVSLDTARTIVDVGGGQGHLLADLLRALPGATGVVLDRPDVFESAPRPPAEVAGRMELRPGSFFEEVPAGADVYVLSRIIHDWPDDDAVAILRACRAGMDTDARLYLLEQLATDPDTLSPEQQVALATKDLNMLVLVGGQERTLRERVSRWNRITTATRATSSPSLRYDPSANSALSGRTPTRQARQSVGRRQGGSNRTHPCTKTSGSDPVCPGTRSRTDTP